MKSTTITFKGHEYTVQVGEVFSAWLRSGVINTEYLVQSNDNEKVYLRVVDKLSPFNSLLKVTRIEWDENLKHVMEDESAVYESVPGLNLDTDFESMTKKELVTFINDNNLNINTKQKKADIINNLRSMVI